MRKNAGPTRGFLASPGVGPGATVGTVKIGYPAYKLQVKTKDKMGVHARVSHGSGSCLSAQESSGAATCPMNPARLSWLRAAPEPLRASWLQLPPPGPGAAPGPSRAPWALAPASWLRAAPELPRVSWAGSTGHELLK
jgi:hypothetical protein